MLSNVSECRSYWEDNKDINRHLDKRLALWLKFSANNILKYFFSYFSWKTGFDVSCKLSPKETICMKCQNLFSGKNKKNIINLLAAELAQIVVKINRLNV